MKRFLLFLICILVSVVSYSQLTIRVTSVPAGTPAGASIYIAGTMNNWNPGDAAYKLAQDTSGQLSITFTPAVGTVKFKFTQGSWDKVEGTASGGFLQDRSISYSGSQKKVDMSIAGWEGNTNAGNSTASPQVSILSDTFYMPQLKSKRRIWLYLPKDYNKSTKSYPVLYMHDGQNLFDRQTSFSGEWRIDESLDSMLLKGDHGCIVVGIDNGGGERLNEYSPWINPQYGGGKGDKYIQFIVNTLKPYIDGKYRTMTDNENTGIMGSSMGGLISMYAGIAYPEVFGKTGALSSAFWFSQESFKQVSDTGVKSSGYFYLIAGGQEGGSQTADMQKMATTLKLNGAPETNVNSTIHPDGKHNEVYWAREFPNAYKWLFEKKTTSLNGLSGDQIKIISEQGKLVILTETDITGGVVRVFNSSGQLLLTQILDFTKSVNTGFIEPKNNIYYVHIECNSNFLSVPVLIR
jgi:predicted alpha/beta superfamily hydrolase